MTDEHGSDELGNMAEYLKILYYWFLLGPIITLEWLRRKKKLCCVTISQQVHEESAAGNEENARLVPRVDEDQEQNVQDITGGEIESESQLLITTADTDTDITIFDLMGRIIVRVTRIFGIRYLAFLYFTVYNMMCTVSNFLFIIILNKHKVVTRYVFYISVCMICAYVESDIVAVFYFILNSQGSLNNLKLTALRTVALGLTLTLSFSSSMHIIRKLMKPQESVFEGLSER
nr:uncharacterized protein LOC131770426 [Pocillopora verrucosa]XP_058942121.1 uncharacterized protein LOC131770427 [Pocillopora verrucosa]